jgi:hypothetical protein
MSVKGKQALYYTLHNIEQVFFCEYAEEFGTLDRL